MPHVLEEYEFKLLKRFLYAFAGLFCVFIFAGIIVQILWGDFSKPHIINIFIRIISFLINLTFILLLLSGYIDNPKLRNAGLILLLFNFISSRFAQFTVVPEIDISLFLYMASVMYVLILGMFTRRTSLIIIFSILLYTAFYIIYVIKSDIFYPNDTLDEIKRNKFLIIAGFFLIEFMILFIVNHSIQSSLYNYLETSRDYMKNLAFHDQETGLKNGLGLEHYLASIFFNMHTDKENGVLVGFKFESFPELNELYGYHETSNWLKHFAMELESEIGFWFNKKSEIKNDIEFNLFRPEASIFVFPVVINKENISADIILKSELIKTVQAILNKSEMGGKLRFFGAFTVFPDDADDISCLQRNLLNILHEVKGSKYNEIVPFDLTKYGKYLRKQLISEQMRLKDFEEDIEAWFQPKVSSIDGKCIGYEALARWIHPELGPISPVEFIPIAESIGKIMPITIKILSDIASFIDEVKNYHSDKNIIISFNLSPVLIVPNVLEKIEKWIKERGLSRYLEVEITEGILLRTSEIIQIYFRSWKKSGMQFSIDDFGTGYSNLSYLQSFDADVIKIDKQFIDGIPNNDKNANLVKVIILVARSFGMHIIAEGVEYQEQAEFLKDLGCDAFQGYLYAKPMKFDDAVEYCKRNHEL